MKLMGTQDTQIVIMAGGVGSRLYPLSTPEHPKQFIDLLGCGKTMIQLTRQRFLEVAPDAGLWVVTSERYLDFVQEQLPDIPRDHILLEPEARNTAPCIAYASRKIALKHPDANIIVTPADAYVPDCKAFAATMREALKFTESQKAIVCVGIQPTRPETGYGYINAPGVIDTVVKTTAFKEKPDLETAERYLSEGGYYWNAGIFVWNVRTIESELRSYAPQIEGVMDELEPALYTDKEQNELACLFPTCEKISIDYAVMEKTPHKYMIAADWMWTDLGSFKSIEEVTGKKIVF